MPRPIIVDTATPLTETKLARLESVLGHRLPAAYRRFLLESNGGRPVPEAFGKEGGLRSILSVFFSVGARDKLDDLAAQFKKTRKDMPAEVLPIAFDLGGNKICLAFKGKKLGKVYFWDHEGVAPRQDIRAKYPEIKWKPYAEGEPRPKTTDDWPGYPDLSLVADSFDEFLDSFHDGDKPPARRKKKPSQRRKT